MVGVGTESLHVLAEIFRVGERTERDFKFELRFRIAWGEAVERPGIVGKRAGLNTKSDDKSADRDNGIPMAFRQCVHIADS